MPDIDLDLDALDDEEQDEQDRLDPSEIQPEPGSPSAENTAFVVLGVAAMVAVILHLAGVF